MAKNPEEKKFALRIHRVSTYEKLSQQADKKNWSVNLLINTILEDHLKAGKKKIA